MDTKVSCIHCGREESVSFAYCLRHGWPKCCRYTMRMMSTDADIDAAVGGIIRPVVSTAYRLAGAPTVQAEGGA